MTPVRRIVARIVLLGCAAMLLSLSPTMAEEPPPTEPTEEPCPDPNGDVDDGATPIFRTCSGSSAWSTVEPIVALSPVGRLVQSIRAIRMLPRRLLDLVWIGGGQEPGKRTPRTTIRPVPPGA